MKLLTQYCLLTAGNQVHSDYGVSAWLSAFSK